MHDHAHHQDQSVSTLRLAFFLNVAFTLTEIVGGILTGSIAILADAVHDLGDSLALGLAWWFEGIARNRPANERFTYGYRRFSLLASLLNGVVLTAGSTLILTHAIPRLLDPQPSHAAGMIGFAIVGVLVNGWAALKTGRGSTMNESVVSWHLLEDVLGWVAVLCGALVMQFTNWWWIDPLLAIAIAAFILFNIVRRLWKIAKLFLQVAPEGIDVDLLQKELAELDGVEGVHHLHIWSLDGEHHVATTHVSIAGDADPRAIKADIRSRLATSNFDHVTVEIDLDDEDCSLG